jgi:hypothetical protein
MRVRFEGGRRFADAPWTWHLCANARTEPALAVQQSGRGIADDFAIYRS